ncbi:MAG: Rod shape-determining protein RodA [Parcubacteria group bacterium GW2011_GWA2_44_12]|nr:MAG: Rod shape-determining protein RodA [Parcubacteria group bacterium GW2011_GWA2_44_12]
MKLRAFFGKLKKMDFVLLTATFLITLFSLINIYTLEINTGNGELFNFKKQVIALAIGAACMVFFAVIDYRWYRDGAYLAYAVGLILLALVLAYGNTIRGTTGWFKIGAFSLQPVEFAKVFTVLALGRFIAEMRGKTRSALFVIGTAVITFAPVFLIILQKDFGSTILFFGTWATLLFLAKIPKSHALIVYGLFIAVSIFGWHNFLAVYQKNRILNFIDPTRDPLGTGYNVTQSLIAIGSGRILGRGLGLGSQSSLNFLPEQQTDFIFATIAEGTGIIGATLLILFLLILFLRFLRISKKAKEVFGIFAAAGIAAMFFIQTAISIFMNLGLAPVTGLPFPLVSVGGSSLVASFIMIGIMQSIAIHRSEE